MTEDAHFSLLWREVGFLNEQFSFASHSLFKYASARSHSGNNFSSA